MLLSNKIFGRIREKEMTIAEVAKEMKMRPQTLSKKIKGESRIYHDEIMALSKILSLDDSEIISFFIRKCQKNDTIASISMERKKKKSHPWKDGRQKEWRGINYANYTTNRSQVIEHCSTKLQRTEGYCHIIW